jgi:hypothetical protein
LNPKGSRGNEFAGEDFSRSDTFRIFRESRLAAFEKFE